VSIQEINPVGLTDDRAKLVSPFLSLPKQVR